MANYDSGMSEEIKKIVLDKIEIFNRGKKTENGQYYIVLPNSKTAYYTLWFYDPDTTYHHTIYLAYLDLNVIGSVNKALKLVANSYLPLFITREIQTFLGNGDNILTFGKYRGHYMHDVYTIDPRYIVWIANKFEAHVRSEIRFKELASIYKKVYLDLHTKKRYKIKASQFVGSLGEKLLNLNLTVTKVSIEDDYYKTRIVRGTEYFYVDQLLTARDDIGNLFLIRVKAKDRSLATQTLATGTYEYRVGDQLKLKSAKVLKHLEIHNIKYTRIGYICQT